MRLFAAVLLSCFLFASTWSGDPADPNLDVDTRPPDFTEWETMDKVLETLGKPNKRRADGKGGTILTYKFPVNSGLKLVTGELRIDVDGVPTSAPSNEDCAWSIRLPDGGVGPESTGKMKARFYFDGDGYVYDVELDPVKWKGRR